MIKKHFVNAVKYRNTLNFILRGMHNICCLLEKCSWLLDNHRSKMENTQCWRQRRVRNSNQADKR